MRLRETNGWEVVDYTPVEFIDNMGDDYAILNAARVSFDKDANSYSNNGNQKLMDYLARHNHWTPFAHTSVKFRFRAPIFIARQFVKHQVGFVWNEVSRRYVDADPWFFIPDSWRKRPDNMKQGSVFEDQRMMDGNLLDSYRIKMREHAKDYKELRSAQVCPEQVRMILPQSMMTEWIWTGSLAAWNRFVQLRLDKHAQAECWPYAKAVQEQLYKLYPMAMESFRFAQNRK